MGWVLLVQSPAILGIVGTLVPPPMLGGPDGYSHYTCDLSPPRGRTRRRRLGWLPAMSHGGPPHLWAEMRATHSSPPLSSASVSLTGARRSHGGGAQGACLRLAAKECPPLASPGLGENGPRRACVKEPYQAGIRAVRSPLLTWPRECGRRGGPLDRSYTCSYGSDGPHSPKKMLTPLVRSRGPALGSAPQCRRARFCWPDVLHRLT